MLKEKEMEICEFLNEFWWTVILLVGIALVAIHKDINDIKMAKKSGWKEEKIMPLGHDPD
ncbi:hypothetical protein A2363_05115 [Candidatus Gottesmanbacteria bacterium RIFOXYB1_FULL_47_11]|uniref:Uncharacterized protein n=1 Tax=Candidatus Gottesmanbacteria bacterium RIFOXYB1_FULL_47_11 TaxID=1798401 RepID=A0A1F6BFA0_9BACT|nr:MAG: hypothetical protein A2363_05115 [Candidatus Gottesmanbacteria bacterium RIFOXYB1_FULL_47_11]